AGTFLVSLPGMFGSRAVCTSCLIWASPLLDPIPLDGPPSALVGVAFSALVVGSWLLAARPLVRDLQWVRGRQRGLYLSAVGRLGLRRGAAARRKPAKPAQMDSGSVAVAAELQDASGSSAGGASHCSRLGSFPCCGVAKHSASTRNPQHLEHTLDASVTA